MKKDIHPPLYEIKVTLNGLEFKTYSTQKKDMIYSHTPVTLEKLRKKGASKDSFGVKKFQDKYGDLYSNNS